MNASDSIFTSQDKIIVIGIGNPYRQDDAIGLNIARQLKNENIPGITIFETIGDSTNIIEQCKDAKTVILIDAMFSGTKPGTILRFDIPKEFIPEEIIRMSTHSFSIIKTIQLMQELEIFLILSLFFASRGKSSISGKDFRMI
ncbi:hydrogenase maturation protease [candidate division KSB1 bacterium]